MSESSRLADRDNKVHVDTYCDVRIGGSLGGGRRRDVRTHLQPHLAMHHRTCGIVDASLSRRNLHYSLSPNQATHKFS